MTTKKLSAEILEITTERKRTISKRNIEEKIVYHEAELAKLNDWLKELKK